MKRIIALQIVAGLLAACPSVRADEPFTDEASILAVSREDQSNALKIKLLKKEFTLSEVITVLTKYKRVTREQYLQCDHQLGVKGSVTLKGGKTYQWNIEPDYAGTVTSGNGDIVYLLKPAPEGERELKAKGAGKNY